MTFYTFLVYLPCVDLDQQISEAEAEVARAQEACSRALAALVTEQHVLRAAHSRLRLLRRLAEERLAARIGTPVRKRRQPWRG